MAFQRHIPRSSSMQGALFEAEPREIHRLFFALMPNATARDRMGQTADSLKTAHRLSGKWVAPARYHMTLHFLGDNSELRTDLRDAAIAAAACVHLPPVTVQLDGAYTFRRASERGKSPGVLRDTRTNPPVSALWKTLADGLAKQGLGKELERGFVPHVTLLYQDQDRLPDVAIAPIHWLATEFVLVHSVFGRADYTLLGRWRLTT